MKPVDTEKNIVYWAEVLPGEGLSLMWGYLLACYDTSQGRRYIVTLGNITSCVVRHLDKIAKTKAQAFANRFDTVQSQGCRVVSLVDED